MKSALSILVFAFAFACHILSNNCAFAAGDTVSNAGTVVSGAGETNSLPASDDAEAKEIRRLMALGVGSNGQTIDERAVYAAAELKWKRLARYLEHLKRTQDPVAIAEKMAFDLEVDPRWAVGIFTEHWSDPRSEATLAVLAKRGPHRIGELATPFGLAYGGLLEVRARKQHKQIVAGRQSEREQALAIMEFIQNRPELTVMYPTNESLYHSRQLLFKELEKSEDPAVVRLLFKSAYIPHGFAKKHFELMLQFAQEINSDEAINNSKLIERLYESGDKRVTAILQKWLDDAKTEEQRSYLKSALRELQKTRDN